MIKKKRVEIFKTCWTNYLLMKKQMKSLIWITRIKQKHNDELTFKWIVIQSWWHEFRRKLEMLCYLNEKSIIFIDDCKKSKKCIWMIYLRMSIDWFRSTRQIERAIKFSTETTTTMMNSWHFVIVCYIKNWYVKRQYEWCRLVYKSFVDDVIICYAWSEDWII